MIVNFARRFALSNQTQTAVSDARAMASSTPSLASALRVVFDADSNGTVIIETGFGFGQAWHVHMVARLALPFWFFIFIGRVQSVEILLACSGRCG